MSVEDGQFIRRRAEHALTPEQIEHRKLRAVETRANTVKRPMRNRAIVELRTAGLTYAEIAQQITNLGQYGKCSEMTVMKVLQKELEKLADQNRDDVDKLRAIDLHRIDQALRVLWPKVREGNLKAMREWRAFIDQRARLLGTYAAQKHEVKGQIDHVLDSSAKEEIARLEEAFLAAGSFDGTAEEEPPDVQLLEP
jgi:hypothetical protein